MATITEELFWEIVDESIDGIYRQYIRKINDHTFDVIEHVTYDDKANHLFSYYMQIDLQDYTEEEMLIYLQPYGYAERQDPQIEAEIIAETDGHQEYDCCINADNIGDILRWQKQYGIPSELLLNGRLDYAFVPGVL